MSDTDPIVKAKAKDSGITVYERQSVIDSNPDAFQVLKSDDVFDHNGVPRDPEFPSKSDGAKATGESSKKES